MHTSHLSDHVSWSNSSEIWVYKMTAQLAFQPGFLRQGIAWTAQVLTNFFKLTHNEPHIPRHRAHRAPAGNFRVIWPSIDGLDALTLTPHFVVYILYMPNEGLR